MLRNRTTFQPGSVKPAPAKPRPGLFLQPFVVSQLVGGVIDTVVEGSGLTAREFAVASCLNVVGGATPTELAHDLGLSPTTLSAIIDRLVRKRQVRRVRHPEDGRSYVLQLTGAGRKTNTRNGRRFAEALRRLHTHLDDDPEEILASLRRLEDALRALLRES